MNIGVHVLLKLWLSPDTCPGIGLLDYMGFPCNSVDKESACSAGDPGSVPVLGRSSGEGNGNHSSILAWRIPWPEEPGGLHTVHGVTQSRTRLCD